MKLSGNQAWNTSSLFILFNTAGVYWIYTLSIHPGCLKGNFQYTPALEKRMAIHCLESGWIGKYAPSAMVPLKPRGANFKYTLLSQCVVTLFSGGRNNNTMFLKSLYIFFQKRCSKKWGGLFWWRMAAQRESLIALFKVLGVSEDEFECLGLVCCSKCSILD